MYCGMVTKAFADDWWFIDDGLSQIRSGLRRGGRGDETGGRVVVGIGKRTCAGNLALEELVLSSQHPVCCFKCGEVVHSFGFA